MWRRQQHRSVAAAAAVAAGATVLTLLLVVESAVALPAPQGELREQVYRNYREDLEEPPVPRSLGGSRSLASGRVRRPMPGGLDSLSGVTFGTSKRLDPLSGGALGNQKRNFDEIDRMGFNGFVKRNFDEIDRTGFDSFVKRNFDEIDRVGFASFVKRNAPALLARYYEKHGH